MMIQKGAWLETERVPDVVANRRRRVDLRGVIRVAHCGGAGMPSVLQLDGRRRRHCHLHNQRGEPGRSPGMLPSGFFVVQAAGISVFLLSELPEMRSETAQPGRVEQRFDLEVARSGGPSRSLSDRGRPRRFPYVRGGNTRSGRSGDASAAARAVLHVAGMIPLFER